MQRLDDTSCPEIPQAKRLVQTTSRDVQFVELEARYGSSVAEKGPVSLASTH